MPYTILSTDEERYANYVRTKGQISLELGMNSPMPYKNSTVLGQSVLDKVALRIFLTVSAETKMEYTPTGQ